MASKRISSTVSATERIDTQIAELKATKQIIEFIEEQLEAATSQMNDYQNQIDEEEAAGETVREYDWRRQSIKEYRLQRSALIAVMEKLIG